MKKMTIKNIFKLLLPPIIPLLTKKIINNSKKTRPSLLQKIVRKTERMVVIVNGPSLNDTVKKYKDVIVQYDRICVNFFSSSELYCVLKPTTYVFADPIFWEFPENKRESIEQALTNIIEKTEWPLTVVIPEKAKNTLLENTLKKNRNISFQFYSNNNQETSRLNKYDAWDQNVSFPTFRNVLHLSIYLSLFWGYKETYIIGADASYGENIRIDQETNQLYSVEPHFYKHETVYTGDKHMNNYNGTPLDYSLDEWYRRLHLHFAVYKELLEYANYKCLKVFNASEYSWIDVFERKKLS